MIVTNVNKNLHFIRIKLTKVKKKKKLAVQTTGQEMGLEILSYAAGGIVNWYNYFLKNKTAKSSKDEDVHTLGPSNFTSQ